MRAPVSRQPVQEPVRRRIGVNTPRVLGGNERVQIGRGGVTGRVIMLRDLGDARGQPRVRQLVELLQDVLCAPSFLPFCERGTHRVARIRLGQRVRQRPFCQERSPPCQLFVI